jgi:hypothetical protein
MPRLPGTRSLPLRPIAAALVASLCLAPYQALATQFVTTCDDAGPGSLRAALLAAAELFAPTAERRAPCSFLLPDGKVNRRYWNEP